MLLLILVNLFSTILSQYGGNLYPPALLLLQILVRHHLLGALSVICTFVYLSIVLFIHL